MRNAALQLLACTALFFLPLTAQDKKFTGTWEARFEGRVFLTVKVLPDAKITGTVSTGSITVDHQGTLVKGEPAEVEHPAEILKPRADGDTLSFQIVDSDDPPMKLELHITGDGRAELRFIDSPAPFKPLPLTRA
jgi:hypothetical protein